MRTHTIEYCDKVSPCPRMLYESSNPCMHTVYATHPLVRVTIVLQCLTVFNSALLNYSLRNVKRNDTYNSGLPKKSYEMSKTG